MKFSQRIGVTPIEKEIQLNFIDNELRNGLWNVYLQSILNSILGKNHLSDGLSGVGEMFANHLWHNHYKLTIDSIPYSYESFFKSFKYKFVNDDWFEVYDLIEASLGYLISLGYFRNSTTIEKEFNRVLEREFAGYRIIDGCVSRITNSQETSELKEALSNTSDFSTLKGCNIHLRMALSKLSDKSNPDYRNSIKESISAVESLTKVLSGRSNDTLGASLDRIKGSINIHSALEKGFKQLYNYTSDEGGIRHALMEVPNCDFEDAKYMLISCSAFINYLISKANKADIRFNHK